MYTDHNPYPEMNEQEKTFGGIFTVEQIGWTIGGLILGLIVAVPLYFLIGFFCIPFFLVVFGGGIYLAFVKKYEMSMPKYLRLKRKFKNSQKEYCNRRQGVKFSVSPIYEKE